MADFESKKAQCLRLLLRPAVRFFLRHSLTYQEFQAFSREVFVDVAAEELQRAGKTVNASRVSLMTGLQRRHVKPPAPLPKHATSLVSRVLATWENDRRFTTKAKLPRVLADKGQPSQFEELVRAVDNTIHPGTVLFELLRIGAVAETRTGIRLVKRTNHFGRDAERVFEVLSRDLESLTQAAYENLTLPKGEQHLHLRTEYDNLRLEDLPTIQHWLATEGRKLHKRARAFLSQFDNDVNYEPGKAAGGKAVLSAFALTEEPSSTE